MKRNPTQSTFVYDNLIYMELTKASSCEWYVFLRSCKAKSCKVMQHYAESCNATQDHATSRKVMQRHAKSCKVQGKSHTSPVGPTLLSQRFAYIQAF